MLLIVVNKSENSKQMGFNKFLTFKIRQYLIIISIKQTDMGICLSKNERPKQKLLQNALFSSNCKGKPVYHFKQEAKCEVNQGNLLNRNQRLQYPYCAIALIVAIINDGPYRSTGFFISQDTLITPAHSVCKLIQNQFKGHKASKVTVTVYKGEQEQITYKAKRYWYHPKYQTSLHENRSQYNYGIVVLKQKVNCGYFGIIQNWEKRDDSRVTTAYHQIEPNENIQKIEPKENMRVIKDGIIQRQQGPFLYYRFDTIPGSSGSPLFIKTSQYNYQVVGFHLQSGIIENKKLNRGLKITKEMRQLINKNAPKHERRQAFNIYQQIQLQ